MELNDGNKVENKLDKNKSKAYEFKIGRKKKDEHLLREEKNRFLLTKNLLLVKKKIGCNAVTLKRGILPKIKSY